MKTKFMANIVRSASKIGLKVRKRSPEIMIVAGVAGVISATVGIGKASTKVNDIIEPARAELDKIHKTAEKVKNGETVKLKDGGVYTMKDVRNDTTITYGQTIYRLAKLYGPSILVLILSLGCIIGSHRILTKRNAALAAAYATVDNTFKEYRSRLIDRFGEDLDRQLFFNVENKEIEEEVVDESTGEITTVIKTVEAVNPKQLSMYARVFNHTCKGWNEDADVTKSFLYDVEKFADWKLKRQGYLFLNDVFDMLGLPRTQAGQMAGWLYEEGDDEGDGYVDLGIKEFYNADFHNGYERNLWIDPNVQGDILSHI